MQIFAECLKNWEINFRLWPNGYALALVSPPSDKLAARPAADDENIKLL
jgi:hypothetical protein